ncbi:MAG: hypothetical protein HDS95_07355 [Bacteroidales bacterium]|nr:hypothetical protein [Bacteroidales bacterium]
MKEKINIDILPCTNKSVGLWYWVTIVLVALFTLLLTYIAYEFISELMKPFYYRSSSSLFDESVEDEGNSVLDYIFMLLSFAPVVFFSIFSKASRVLKHKISTLLNIAIGFYISGMLLLWWVSMNEDSIRETTETTIWLLICFCMLAVVLLSIISGILIQSNYSGEVGNLGKGIIIFPLIAVASMIVIYFVLSIGSSHSYHIKLRGKSILFLVIAFYYTPYYLIWKVLTPAYDVLRNGLMLAERDVETFNLFKRKDLVIDYSNGEAKFMTYETHQTGNCLKDNTDGIAYKIGKATDTFAKRAGLFFKKIGLVRLAIFLGVLLIGGGTAFFIYQHNKNEKAKKARIVYYDLSEEYFPGNEYDEPNGFITKGKFDGKHEDVLALFPVEDTEFFDNGEKLYKKLVIKSERCELPDLEITVDDLPDFANYGGIPYDDSLFFLTTIDGTYEKRKGIQTGVAIQMNGSYAGAALEAAKYYLKNGKWTKGEPGGFEEEVKIEEADNHNSVGSSINSTFRNQDDSNYSAPREKVVSSQPNSLGFRPGKNSFKADMIHTDGRRFPFDLSLNYNPNGNPEITNAVYYNPSAGAKVELKVDVYNDGFMRLSGTSGGKAFILEFSGSNPYTGDAWWGDLHMDVEMSLK